MFSKLCSAEIARTRMSVSLKIQRLWKAAGESGEQELGNGVSDLEEERGEAVVD